MANHLVTQRICEQLQRWKQNMGFKLEYVESWTEMEGHKVSRQTVSRVLNGRVERLHGNSAQMLAAFVEMISDGAVRAAGLLEENQIVKHRFENETMVDKNFPFYRFEKVMFRNVSLKNVRFERIVFRNVAFSNCRISKIMVLHSDWVNVDFTGCLVSESTFSNVQTHAVKWRDTELKNCTFKM